MCYRHLLSYSRHCIVLILIFGISAFAGAQVTGSPLDDRPATTQQLLDRANQRGTLPVILRLRIPGYVPEGRLTASSAAAAQRNSISGAQSRVLARLSPLGSEKTNSLLLCLCSLFI